MVTMSTLPGTVCVRGMRSAVRWGARRAEHEYRARFREVWALWDFEDEPGEAHHLWPMPVPEAIGSRPPRRWEDSHQAVDDEGVVHAVDLESENGDGLCGAYLQGDFRGEPSRCPECDAILRGGPAGLA